MSDVDIKDWAQKEVEHLGKHTVRSFCSMTPWQICLAWSAMLNEVTRKRVARWYLRYYCRRKLKDNIIFQSLGAWLRYDSSNHIPSLVEYSR